jgi:cell division protein FtsI/penicillin-binding protein 2
MKAVVTLGSGQVLKGLVTGAKSGTAEFTQDGQTLTHAWFIAYNDQYAIAAYVDDGVGGTVTAAPLIKAFLS